MKSNSMKALSILFSLMLSVIFVSAQTQKCYVSERYVLVGSADVKGSADVIKDGLFTAHIDRQQNQIALVAGQPFTSYYYAIYAEDGTVITTGKVVLRHAGQFKIVDLRRYVKTYGISFSTQPYCKV